MIFLTLALIASIATSVHFYILLVSNRKSSEESINILSGIITDNEKSRRQAEEQYNEEIKKLNKKNREAFDEIHLLKEKIESQENLYVKTLKDNETLHKTVEKLSQKELIEECRAFYNALEQRKKDILAALNSLESSFNSVKRVYSAQTTVDDCVTTIKSVPVQPPTITASGKIDKWPYESKFWNGDSE